MQQGFREELSGINTKSLVKVRREAVSEGIRLCYCWPCNPCLEYHHYVANGIKSFRGHEDRWKRVEVNVFLECSSVQSYHSCFSRASGVWRYCLQAGLNEADSVSILSWRERLKGLSPSITDRIARQLPPQFLQASYHACSSFEFLTPNHSNRKLYLSTSLLIPLLQR